MGSSDVEILLSNLLVMVPRQLVWSQEFEYRRGLLVGSKDEFN